MMVVAVTMGLHFLSVANRVFSNTAKNRDWAQIQSHLNNVSGFNDEIG